MHFLSILSASNDSIQAGSDSIHDEIKLVIKTKAGELLSFRKDLTDSKSHSHLESLCSTNQNFS